VPGTGAGTRIAVVVKGYPRLSETFIAQEIHGLERRGLALSIVSLRHPTDPAAHPIHRAIRAPLLYLPEYLHEEPQRVLRAWRQLRRSASYRAARALWWRDLARERSRNRVRRFGQALVLAAELPADVGLIYAHYLHTPASVARYAARLTGLPFCISAHAKDIWTTPDWEKREKLLDCRWLTTCTRDGADHLQTLAPAARVMLTHHGLDPTRFPARGRPPGPDGTAAGPPVRLLGVARLVPKKGVDVLLEALARLPADLSWRYEHIGDGALQDELKGQSARLGLHERVSFLGARAHDEVLDAYRRAEIVVLANRIAADGDRDGLPNVLLEAASQEAALVASRSGAASELIVDGTNGRLVPPDQPDALARVLERLIRAPAERLALGRAARKRVLEDFAMEPGLDRIATELRAVLEDVEAKAA
jgi:glycosyltransferase involved in cell wall biosynthesis